MHTVCADKVDSHFPVKSPMQSDRHYGRFFGPEFVLNQFHIKGNHQCSETAILDNGQFLVAIWQVHSRYCGQMSIFNISL